jgi:hypothetical protein
MKNLTKTVRDTLLGLSLGSALVFNPVSAKAEHVDPTRVLYSDFSTSPLNTNKWSFFWNFAPTSISDVQTNTKDFQISQSSTGLKRDVRLTPILSPFPLSPGEYLEEKVTLVSGEGNHLFYISINDPTKEVENTNFAPAKSIGFWNGVGGGIPREIGDYKIRQDFLPNSVKTTIITPTGAKATYSDENLTSPYSPTLIVQTGQNGLIDIRYDDFYTGLSDLDNDGLPDNIEYRDLGGDLNQGPTDDYDNDGVPNLEEITNNTNPGTSNDTDSDSLPDDWETNYAGDLTTLAKNKDLDGDGFSNYQEFQRGTDPTKYLISLKKGWNYFSIASAPDNYTTNSIFLGTSKIGPTWTWDAVDQRYITADEIEPTKGYMVYMNEDRDLELLISR